MSENEIQYLNLDGSGDSPVADYPGRIRFPLIMTLPMHKRWQGFINARGRKAEENEERVGAVFIEQGEGNERLLFLYDDVELALMFGDLDLTGPDGKKMKYKTPDDLPLQVAVWIARCYREWENAQVNFRWNGHAGMAAPDSAG